MSDSRREAARYLDRIAGRGIKPGLKRMDRIMAALGHPERRFRAVHVTGTNGKGSVCALVERIARESGLRTGLYTSPHLMDVRERMRVDGKIIPPGDFARWVLRVRRAAGRLEPDLTYFECTTAAAFGWFAERKVDLAVVEVGLGGRLDATNVLPHPEVCVITNTALDHQEYLGDTVEKIAREKAGILKRGSACVTGAVGPGLRVIQRQARALDVQSVLSNQGRVLSTVPLSKALEVCSLKGRFQVQNVRMALCVIKILRERGFDIPDGAIWKGLRSVQWPGRFEWRKARLGGKAVPVLLDGAHNPAAIGSLVEALKKTGYAKKPCSLVFNALLDKNVNGMARTLKGVLQLCNVLIPVLDTGRGRNPESVSGAFPGIQSRSFPSVKSLWNDLEKYGVGRARWVLVTGSLYLVGGFLKEIRKEGSGSWHPSKA